jgi:porphobilinogen synthase
MSLLRLVCFVQRPRPRRNRKSPAMRAMIRESIVTPSNFIYPLFIHGENFNTPIASMPGCVRHSLDSMMREIGESFALGVKSFILFPKIPDEEKSTVGEKAFEWGLVHQAVGMIKKAFPDSIVCTDIALDPYSDQGHDGVVDWDGTILNDATVHQLCCQAVSHAMAGADVVAPSDMMVRCELGMS